MSVKRLLIYSRFIIIIILIIIIIIIIIMLMNDRYRRPRADAANCALRAAYAQDLRYNTRLSKLKKLPEPNRNRTESFKMFRDI